MRYKAVIRTLGNAGMYYQKTLESIAQQTIKPDRIIVYLAESYEIPKETIGVERYIYVPKGMVAQRALSYYEVDTEYILFLDDDVYLPPEAVSRLYNELQQYNANVISPCTFQNHKQRTLSKVFKAITGKERPMFTNNRWSYKVMRTAGFAYNNNPSKPVYESQSNAGPCFFCKKNDFIYISFGEELWLDKTYYALPEDQVMFYKMYKKGLKLLTSYDSGIVHLDAGTTMQSNPERECRLVYSEYRNKLIFWHRFIFLPDHNPLSRFMSVLVLGYALAIQFIKCIVYFLIGKSKTSKAFFDGINDAKCYLKSDEYKSLPLI